MANQRIHRWKSQLPLMVVLLSLLLLILVPVLVQRRITTVRREIGQQVNPARGLVSEIQLRIAQEAAGTRGYLFTGETRYAVSHQRARALRKQAYAQLLPLARSLDPGIERKVLALGEQLRPADELLDDFYSGRISRQDYMSLFPRQQVRFQEVTATIAGIQQALHGEALTRSAEINRFESRGSVLTVVLAVLALVAALMVAQLATSYRALAMRLNTRARQQMALTEVARELSGSLGVHEVVQTIAERAVSTTRAFGAYVEQADTPDGSEVTVVAVAGEGGPPKGTRIPYPGSLSEKIIESGEPEIMTEVGAIGERMAPYLQESCRGCSGLIVPLSSEDKVLGALVLLRGPDQEHFTTEEVAHVRVLGDLASAALRRVTLLEAVRDSEEKFRQMAEHLRDVIWLAAPDLSEYYYMSPAFERVWGRSFEGFGRSPEFRFEAVHPDDRERVQAALPRLKRGEYDIQYRIIRPDGEVRWIWSRGYPIRDERGEIFRIAGIMEDVTEQKRAEQERERRLATEREAHAKVATILESITDAFYALDREWRFTYMNHQAARLLQKSPEQVLGRVIWESFPGIKATRFYPEYHRAVAEQKTVEFEEYYDPLNIWVDVRVYPSAEGLSVFFLDVTDRIEIAAEREHLLEREREARIEAERRREELDRVTESRSRLMRGFSHDVKNPLGAADGYLQLLEEGIVDSLTEQQKKSVEKVRASIRTALDLIDDLLALERAEAGELKIEQEMLDPRKVGMEAVEEFRAQADAAGLALTLECGKELPVLHSDPTRIRQVIANLLSNAVKYTERGSVTVKVDVREDGKAPGPGRWIAVEVRDTGPGIPRDQQPLLFQEFRRLKTAGNMPGAGIGLAMSRSIARALHGEITVESEPGRGSTFTLWLPITTTAVNSHNRNRLAAD